MYFCFVRNSIGLPLFILLEHALELLLGIPKLVAIFELEKNV